MTRNNLAPPPPPPGLIPSMTESAGARDGRAGARLGGFRVLNSKIAEVVFGDEADPRYRSNEQRVLERFARWLDKSSRQQVHAACLTLDQRVVSRLSGSAILEIARRLDARHPEVLQNMPILRAHVDRLTVAHKASEFFSSSALRALTQAILSEADFAQEAEAGAAAGAVGSAGGSGGGSVGAVGPDDGPDHAGHSGKTGKTGSVGGGRASGASAHE